MATDNVILDITVAAAEDLSSDQFKFVVLDSTNKTARRPDSAVEVAYGVLQNAPGLGEAAVVRIAGISKVVANAALTVGTYVSPEYVAADDAGKAQNAAGELQCARGIVVQSAGAENDLASILLFGPNPQRITISVPLPALTANTSVYLGCFAAYRAMQITKINIAAYTIPVDADGTALLAISNYDVSGTPAADNLLGAATFDLEAITAAKTTQTLTLTSTAADLILAAGDYVYATLTSNSAAIDTNMAGGNLTFEIDLL